VACHADTSGSGIGMCRASRGSARAEVWCYVGLMCGSPLRLRRGGGDHFDMYLIEIEPFPCQGVGLESQEIFLQWCALRHREQGSPVHLLAGPER